MTATTASLSLQAFSSDWREPMREIESVRARTRYLLPARTGQYSSVSAWSITPARMLVASNRAVENLRSIIRVRFGFLAARRFRKLASYQLGWDGDQARSLSPDSAALAAAFIRAFGSFPTKPSLFLTRNGGFALSWNKMTGDSIEVTFEDFQCRISSRAGTTVHLVTEPEQIKGIVRALAV